MDSYDDIKARVSGWIASQRKGEDAELACFWTMYPVATLTTNPAKQSPVFCENYHISNIEESSEFLMEQMGNAPHIRYYAVRLRAKKGDPGPVCNFPNPYYKSSNSSINGLGIPSGDSGIAMTLIGMMQQHTEQRISAKEENTQYMIQALQIQSQQAMDQFKKEMKYENKIAALKEEVEGLKSSKSSPLIDFISEIKPELTELIKYKISGRTPYEEEEEEEEIGKHESDKKEKEDIVLGNAIELLKNRVRRPEELIYKMAFVLDHMDDESADNLMGMVQKEYKKYAQKEQE